MPPKPLTFTEAAYYVLEKFSQKEPMHYKVITEKALELGVLQTTGQTPDATLYSVVLREIERVRQQGGNPRFVMQKGGFISLAEWNPKEAADFDIQQQIKAIHKRLIDRLNQMGSDELENLVRQLLIAMDFIEVAEPKLYKDKGVDVRGTLIVGSHIPIKIAVQVKKWAKNNVQSSTIQQLYGALDHKDGQEKGVVITSSDFAKGAREEALRLGIVLINGDKLADMILQHSQVRSFKEYLQQLALGFQIEQKTFYELTETSS